MKRKYEVVVGIESQEGPDLGPLLRWSLERAKQNGATVITVREVITAVYDLVAREVMAE